MCQSRSRALWARVSSEAIASAKPGRFLILSIAALLSGGSTSGSASSIFPRVAMRSRKIVKS